ncbi:cupin domain-containing protein [Acetobacter sicerae]|nr:cupin domain-containing protein [Acetobacter sicerae]NHN90857.1 cupin domain-containing protein [Acetobacter sicerae]
MFDWHHHEHEDELFLVVSGTLRMHSLDHEVDIETGEFIIVPHGIEPCSEALSDECHVVLLEPNTTFNTGNVTTDGTVHTLSRI